MFTLNPLQHHNYMLLELPDCSRPPNNFQVYSLGLIMILRESASGLRCQHDTKPVHGWSVSWGWAGLSGWPSSRLEIYAWPW